MKKFKRIISGLTAAVLFLVVGVFSDTGIIGSMQTSAAGIDYTVFNPITRPSVGYGDISISTAEAKPGETVTLSLNVETGDNMEAMDVIIAWSDKRLTATAAKSASLATVASEAYDGFLTFVAYSNAVVQDGRIAAIDFTVPEDAVPGTVYDINFVKINGVYTLKDEKNETEKSEDITNVVGIKGGRIVVPVEHKLSCDEIDMQVGDMKAINVVDYEDEVTWISDDTTVVRVEDGVVRATGAGNATIYAIIDNVILTCKANVTGESETTTTTAVTTATTKKTTATTTSVSTSGSVSVITTKKTAPTSISGVSVTSPTIITTIDSSTTKSSTSYSIPISSYTTDTSGTDITSDSGTETYPTSVTSTDTSGSGTGTETTVTSVSTTYSIGTTEITNTPSNDDGTTVINLYKGDITQLNVNGYDGPIRWITLDNSVASIDSKGYLRAIDVGSTVIIALLEDSYLIGVVNVMPRMTTNGLLGDADQNGVVDVRDSCYIARMLAEGKQNLLPPCADYNCDGVINVRDASLIARRLSMIYIVVNITIKFN